MSCTATYNTKIKSKYFLREHRSSRSIEELEGIQCFCKYSVRIKLYHRRNSHLAHKSSMQEGEKSCEKERRRTSKELEAIGNEEASSPHPRLEHSSDLALSDHFPCLLSPAQLLNAAVVFRWIKPQPMPSCWLPGCRHAEGQSRCD